MLEGSRATRKRIRGVRQRHGGATPAVSLIPEPANFLRQFGDRSSSGAGCVGASGCVAAVDVLRDVQNVKDCCHPLLKRDGGDLWSIE